MLSANIYHLFLLLLITSSHQIQAEENLKCPDIPKLKILPGSGWDALTNKQMNQTINLTYNQCKVTNDGKYLIPDDTEAILMKTTEVNVKADLIEHWSNFTPATASGFHVISAIWPSQYQSLYWSFSDDYQKSKHIIVRNKTLICRTQLQHLIYRIHIIPNADLNEILKKQFSKAVEELLTNHTEKAEYILETIVRDYGTHYTGNVDVGAVFIKEDFLPISFLFDHYHERGKVLSAAKASLDLYGFSWRDKHYLDASLLDEYNKNIRNKKITVIGGPDWSENVAANEWLARTKDNLTLIDRSGDLLTELITPLKFPDVPKLIFKDMNEMLGKAIKNYYTRNIHKGCTNMAAENFNYSANLDDGSCGKLQNDYQFGGIFQTCHQPSNTGDIDKCQQHIFHNPITKSLNCSPKFEIKLLFSQMERYNYRRSLFYNSLRSDSLTIDTYLCIGSSSLLPKYEFGGIYSLKTDNIITKKKTCPPYFSKMKFLKGQLSICVSNLSNENVQHYSLPFGGLISCKTSLRCPIGYSMYFATKYDGNEIHYCTRELNWTVNDYETISFLHRPPFISLSVESQNKQIDNCSKPQNECYNRYVVAFYIHLTLDLLALLYWQRHRVVKYTRYSYSLFFFPRNDVTTSCAIEDNIKNDKQTVI